MVFTELPGQGIMGGDYPCPAMGSVVPGMCAFHSVDQALVMCFVTTACQAVVVYREGAPAWPVRAHHVGRGMQLLGGCANRQAAVAASKASPAWLHIGLPMPRPVDEQPPTLRSAIHPPCMQAWMAAAERLLCTRTCRCCRATRLRRLESLPC